MLLCEGPKGFTVRRSFPLFSASVVALIGIAACGSGTASDRPDDAAAQSVPATTARVYLATALACSNLDAQSARFTPLEVTGPGYATTIEPTEDCAEQEIFSTYVFDVPVPESGEVTITPGNQPGTTLEVSSLSANGGATVFYARTGEGQFEVSVVRDGKDAAVGDAGQR